MSRKIFVNLPVKDLKKSMGFFAALGFGFNKQFTDEATACMVVSDDIYVMLLSGPKFQEFTPKPICDATQQTETLIGLSCDSREEVDDIVRRALAAGGTSYRDRQDFGIMLQHGFQDPDGHIWEFIFMEPSAVQG